MIRIIRRIASAARRAVLGISPDETLVEQILDPTIDFVVGVEAG